MRTGFSSQKVGWFAIDIWLQLMKKLVLSHFRRQHICSLSDGTIEDTDQYCIATVEALGSLPSVALSSPITVKLHVYMLVP